MSTNVKIFRNKDELNTEINRLKNINNTLVAPSPYGPISSWDVSNITNMNDIFRNATSFNQPLDNWNVSNVEYMQGMFSGAKSFNQPLNNWDVSKVENMAYMFYNATSFNQAESLYNWTPKYGVEVEFLFSNSGITKEQQYQILRRWFHKEFQSDNYDRYYDTPILQALSVLHDELYRTPFNEMDVVADLDEILIQQNINWDDYNEDAVEVHKAFNNVNIERYKELIGFDNKEPPITNIVSYIKQKFETYINIAIEETTDNNVSTSSTSRKRPIITKPVWNNTQKKNLKRNLKAIMDKLSLCTYFDNPANNLLIKQTIDFVFRQPAIFINDYINSYIENVTKAYEGDSIQNRLACVKGIFEQFILSMESAIKVIQTSSYNDNPIFYTELLDSINPPDDKTDGFINEWLQEQSENVNWKKLTVKQRMDSLINYVKQRYASNGIVKSNSDLENLFKNMEHWDYYLNIINKKGELMLGGKRKRKHKQTNKRKKRISKKSRKIR